MAPNNPDHAPPAGSPVDASEPLTAPTPDRGADRAPAASRSAAPGRCEGCSRVATLGSARLCAGCLVRAVVANGRLLTAEPTPAELRDRARRAARRRARRMAAPRRRP